MVDKADQAQQEIKAVIENYFQGTYQGNDKLLKKAFHCDAHITGNFDGNYVDFSLSDFIARIKFAYEAGKKKFYDKKIISIEIIADIAIAKAKVLVGEIYCIDLITLININGEWRIRNKSFNNNIA